MTPEEIKMTQTIEQLIAELRDEEVHTFDGFTVADVLEQLTARVRELEEENARLKAAVEYAETIRVENIAYFEKQLATSQLRETQLRKALKAVIKVHGYESGIPVKALAQPSDTSALDAYVAEKVKEYADEARRQMQHATKAVWQRDLAVEELEQRGHSAGCRKNAFGDLCTCGLDETLVAIKESESK